MILQGKNVIYIGGFGGIGYASCTKLLERHIRNLVIFEQHENFNKLSTLQQKYRSTNITFIQVDVTDRSSLEAAYNLAVLELNYQLDCVINGSGVYDDQNPALTVQVNLLGVINSTLVAMEYMDLSKSGNGGLIVNISSITALKPNTFMAIYFKAFFLPQLGVINSTLVAMEYMDLSKSGNGGLIVNISSITALKPNTFMAIYSATKCGILGFTQAMADDFYNTRTGIDFLTICPGGTTTDLIMDPVENSTFKYASQEHRQKNNNSLKQSAEECAECLIQAIEIGSNGSVWVCDLGKLEEIKMPLLWQRQT